MAGVERFKYPLKLHSSQTGELDKWLEVSFKYPLKLHSSQTAISAFVLLRFVCIF